MHLFSGLMRSASAVILAALLAGGGAKPCQTLDKPDEHTVKEVVEKMENPSYAAATAELSLRLLRLTGGTPTRMVSALSLSEALTLLAEGASGETLRELEGAIGLSMDEVREALPAFLATLLSDEQAKFHSANSVWTEKTDFAMNAQYSARIAEAYDAEILPISFSERGSAQKINSWVAEKTDGMIDGMVDDSTVSGLTMLLINALCFDAKWEIPFAAQTTPRPFTCADGRQVSAEFMYCGDDHVYIDCDGTTGLIKPYMGGAYSFVALLPPEGTALEDYLAHMSGADFLRLVGSASYCDELRVRMPRFKSDYTATLNDTLRALGVKRIFDPAQAELDGLGSGAGRLYVDTVLQKTHIDVDTEGTRAAAVTMVMARMTSLRPVEYREIDLNRPFVYAIIDSATGTPLFIGTVADVEAAK